MLAAGLGKRLAKYTKNNTKCMVEVAGKKLIDRAIEAVKNAGIKKFVLVIGYKGENLKKYILDNYSGVLDFVFINNKDYSTTNNIYSFYLAKEELKKDDTILLESDLIYDEYLIRDVVNYPKRNVVVVAKYLSWMDGTCVSINSERSIEKFIEKENIFNEDMNNLYKTVNVYKFSRQFASDIYLPFLEAYMKIQGLSSYYETSLKYICQLPDISLDTFDVGNRPWYEIDDAQDLDIANVLFSHDREKYNLIEKKYGGFWRYPEYIDYCYLVNPFFPSTQMIEKFKNELPILMTQYPSGLNVQNMNAGRLFGVDDNHIVVGNGAAELINALGHIVGDAAVGVNLPSFNEYVRCFNKATINEIDNSKFDYQLNVAAIKESIDKNLYTVIVNPDNPSGFMLSKEIILELTKYANALNKKLIIDESFADFAEKDMRFTLLDSDYIESNPNVIVIKSISKSFGVPGLRLGLLACSDDKLIDSLRKEMQIWNINSFGEYFLQTYQLFKNGYEEACDLIVDERNYLISELSKIPSIKVYPSQANYIMIDLKKTNSLNFAIKLLDDKKIIIKNLSTKNKFSGKNFIRIAVRNRTDNSVLVNSFKELL